MKVGIVGSGLVETFPLLLNKHETGLLRTSALVIRSVLDALKN